MLYWKDHLIKRSQNRLRNLLKKEPRIQFYADILNSTFRDSASFPLISIVVADIKSSPQALTSLITSIQGQSYRNFECLLMDSIHTNIFEDIASQDHRFATISLPKAISVKDAFYRGLQEAVGEWILFITPNTQLTMHTLWHRVRAMHRSACQDVAGIFCAITTKALLKEQHGWALPAPWKYVPSDDLHFLNHTLGPIFWPGALLGSTQLLRQLNHTGNSDSDLPWWTIWTHLLRHGYRLVKSPHIGLIVNEDRDPSSYATEIDQHQTWLESPYSSAWPKLVTPTVYTKPHSYYLSHKQSNLLQVSYSRQKEHQDIHSAWMNPDVLFIPLSPYHVLEMSEVATALLDIGKKCLFVYPDRELGQNNLENEIKQRNWPYVRLRPNLLANIQPRSVFVMNDWEHEVSQLIESANLNGIPTFALIEGVQDFSDTHVKFTQWASKRVPYTRVRYPLLVGQYDKQFITNQQAVTVGSPRIEALTQIRTQLPIEPLVCINSNFTYGIYTKIQKAWIQDAIAACNDNGYTYVISQHPADKMHLKGLVTSDEALYALLQKCSVLVSRFSCVMYEAMALAKPVVYHNPHSEKMDTFQNPMGAYLITHNQAESSEALKIAVQQGKKYKKICKNFFNYHVSIIPSKPARERAAERVADILDAQERIL